MHLLIRIVIVGLFLYDAATEEAHNSSEIEVVEIDPRAGINDELSDNILHPTLGDIPVLNRKVLKGKRVTIREHPYVVSIRRQVSHYLSGAILSKNLFITVAHPLFNVPITELAVVLGENYSDRGSMLYTVVLTVFHEHFDPYTLQNDIVIIRTYEEVTFRGAIKPIKLFSPESKLHGRKAFVTGWGRCDTMGTEICLGRSSKHFPNERLDPMLRTISFDIVYPNPRCEDYTRFEIALYPGMLCLGQSREDDQTCPCLGSPGALLVVDTHLTGILSWGFGCGYRYDLPLIYTDITYYIPWILHNIVVLRRISQRNITGLFQATRAAILSEWIIKTRVITPSPKIRSGRSMELIDLDTTLVKLNGLVFDIRDFINNGTFHMEKLALYDILLGKENDLKKIEIVAMTSTTSDPRPFLGPDAISETYTSYNATENPDDITLNVI